MDFRYRKVSIFSKIIYFILSCFDMKSKYNDEKSVDTIIEKKGNDQKFKLSRKLSLKSEFIDDLEVFSYNGDLDNCSDEIILYIHGGTYIEQPIYSQVNFAKKMSDRLSYTLIMPNYKLAPKGTVHDIYKDMDKVLKRLKNKKIILFGDSAGGGFVLSYGMYLRDKKYPNVTNIIMLSPWLDISLSNEKIKDYEKKDLLSAKKGTIYAGDLWRDDIPNNSYLVSPINGTFDNLPKLTILIGTRDILQPDCEKLHDILNRQKIVHNYIEFYNQGHDYAMYPTKEGKISLNKIIDIIRGE